MYAPGACWIDIGAADGYTLFLAALYGYKMTVGIEYNDIDGLKHVFESIWKQLIKKYSFLSHVSKPNMIYKDIRKLTTPLKTLSSNIPIHAFTFWDGFSTKDSLAIIAKLKYQNVTRACFVRRKNREFSTFENLQPEFNNLNMKITLIKTVQVRYGKAMYVATVVNIT
jgi:hypothetical protein